MAGFWKTYHLHTCEIIRISDLKLCSTKSGANHTYVCISAIILVKLNVFLADMQHCLPKVLIQA